MSSVNRISEYNNEMYRYTENQHTERRHNEIQLEEKRNKQMRESSEQTRIEMNRRMNRIGQNVDKMA
jgi:flagellar basal body P-ring protein FlgI